MEFIAVLLANLFGFLRNYKASPSARVDMLESGMATVARLAQELRSWADG